MLGWIVGLWLIPAALALFPAIFVLLRGKRRPKANSAPNTATLTTPLRENRTSRYVWGAQEFSLPAIRIYRAVTRQRSIRPTRTGTGCLHHQPVMSCTDVRAELTEFVHALRRRAAQMRQRAPHDKAPERSRALADYLDAQADILQTRPWGSPVVQASANRQRGRG